MPTTPVASPSRPSTKLTALEQSTMKKTVMATEAELLRAMVSPGSGIQSILTPSATAIPAASTWPANFVSAGRS